MPHSTIKRSYSVEPNGFDYTAAWVLAEFHFRNLPANVRDLLERVRVECSDLSQNRDLDMPWPKDSDLRERFEEIPAEILAKAAYWIHGFGHWSPLPCIGAHYGGATWKFSNYADQILTAKLGIKRNRRGNDRGWTLAVHEGEIRLQWSDPDSWTWNPVGPATMGTFKRVSRIIEETPSSAMFELSRINGDRYEKIEEVMNSAKTEETPSEEVKIFHNTEGKPIPAGSPVWFPWEFEVSELDEAQDENATLRAELRKALLKLDEAETAAKKLHDSLLGARVVHLKLARRIAGMED